MGKKLQLLIEKKRKLIMRKKLQLLTEKNNLLGESRLPKNCDYKLEEFSVLAYKLNKNTTLD